MPDLMPVMMRNLRLQGILVGHRAGFESMLRTFAEHAVRPVIDGTFELAETQAALARLASGEHFGKICVRV